MHTRTVPLPEEMITSHFAGEAVHRLGIIDADAHRQRNQEQPKYKAWAAGADGGNKGREIDMMAYSIWDPAKKRPVAKALAAADLLGCGRRPHGPQSPGPWRASPAPCWRSAGLPPQTGAPA